MLCIGISPTITYYCCCNGFGDPRFLASFTSKAAATEMETNKELRGRRGGGEVLAFFLPLAEILLIYVMKNVITTRRQWGPGNHCSHTKVPAGFGGILASKVPSQTCCAEIYEDMPSLLFLPIFAWNRPPGPRPPLFYLCTF